MSTLLESSKDKIQVICDILKNETLEPAEEQAAKILKDAHEKAKKIIQEAEAESLLLLKKGQATLEKEREIFEGSLEGATRQALLKLRESVGSELFNRALASELAKISSDPQLMAKLVDALVKAIEKEGTSANVSVLIGKAVSKEAVAKELASKTLELLEKGEVTVGNFSGGVVVRLKDKNLSLDVSDEVLKELIAQFVRADFRELLFKVQ